MIENLFKVLKDENCPYFKERLKEEDLEEILKFLANGINVIYFDNGNNSTFNNCTKDIKKLIWMFGANYFTDYASISNHPIYNPLTPLTMYSLK